MTDKEIKYVTADELAAQSRVSLSTIHRLKNAGKIPYFQPAGKRGRLLFPADAIEQSARPTSPLDDQTAAADLPKRLSGRLPKWMQPPSPNNHE
jgi:hypothetical protein